jgi:transcriptional regulator with XRE-family HTH domain
MNIKEIGEMAKEVRKKNKLTQAELSLVTGVGTRFISEFERGKATCHWGKVILVLNSLGLDISLSARGG